MSEPKFEAVADEIMSLAHSRGPHVPHLIALRLKEIYHTGVSAGLDAGREAIDSAFAKARGETQ